MRMDCEYEKMADEIVALKMEVAQLKGQLAQYKTKLPIDDMINDFKNGVSLSALGKKHNKDKNTIKKYLLEGGISTEEYSRTIERNKQQKKKAVLQKVNLIDISVDELPF